MGLLSLLGAGRVSSTSTILLDAFPGAAIAYSIPRKLSTAYMGNCIKVRRSSDNTLLDIGFVGNSLDTASLLAFVGGGDGFINILYDQSGNGLNLGQSTTSHQPKIVSAGSLITKNGKACIDFTPGSTQFLSITTAGLVGKIFDIYSVLTFRTGVRFSLLSVITPAIAWGVGGTVDSVTQPYTFIQSDGTNGGGSTSFIPVDDSIQKLVNLYDAAGNNYVTTINNSSNFSGVGLAATAIPSGSRLFQLGRETIAGTTFDGQYQEFVAWDGTQTATRSGIKSNMTTYYTLGTDIVTTLPLIEPFSSNGAFIPVDWLANDNTTLTDLEVLDPLIDIGIPYCNVPGSSGGLALFFINSVAQQEYIIIRPVSTINKTSITVSWNAYKVAGATPFTLEWSIDNITWTTTAFTDVIDDDTWHSTTPMVLPVGANNKQLLYIRLGMIGDGSGFYTAIDDFTITGT